MAYKDVPVDTDNHISKKKKRKKNIKSARALTKPASNKGN
jgi:hypothetical protein